MFYENLLVTFCIILLKDSHKWTLAKDTQDGGKWHVIEKATVVWCGTCRWATKGRGPECGRRRKLNHWVWILLWLDAVRTGFGEHCQLPLCCHPVSARQCRLAGRQASYHSVLLTFLYYYCRRQLSLFTLSSFVNVSSGLSRSITSSAHCITR